MAVIVENMVSDDVVVWLRGLLSGQPRIPLSRDLERKPDRQPRQRRVDRIEGVSMPVEQLNGRCDVAGLVECLRGAAVRNHAPQ